jgi:glycerophosphoryl diester phosphodiesterase
LTQRAVIPVIALALGAAAMLAEAKAVAERRAGPAVIVHRGAWAFAPENSLAAYAAAMDYGADGREVDLRRTREDVLTPHAHPTQHPARRNQISYEHFL